MKILLLVPILLIFSCAQTKELSKFKNGDLVIVKMDGRKGTITDARFHFDNAHSHATVRFPIPEKANIISIDTAASGSISGSRHYPPSLYILEDFNYFELELTTE